MGEQQKIEGAVVFDWVLSSRVKAWLYELDVNPECKRILKQLGYRKLEPLTPAEIGDNLDLEVDATYPRSNGSYINTISVDKLLQAQLGGG